MAAASLDVAGPLGQLVRAKDARLVQVGQAPAFSCSGLDTPPEAGELFGQQLVVGCRLALGHSPLAGEEDLGRRQSSAHLSEHEVVEAVRPHVAGQAGAVVTGPDALAVAARVVVDASGLGGAAAVDYRAGPAGTEHKAPQEPALLVGVEAPGREVRVVGAGAGGRREGGLVDDGRAGDCYPLLFRPGDLAGPGPRRSARDRLGAVHPQAPYVGLPAQHAPERAGDPAPAARRGHTFGVEGQGDLSEREPAGGVVGEDAPHDRGLGLVYHQVSRPVALAGHAGVAERRLPVHRFASAGAKELAPAAALGDLRPLVLRYYRLDLGQKPRLGVGGNVRRVEVAHGGPVAGELVAD